MFRFANNRGLTLIEVIASLVIISIILLSFLGLFIHSKKTNVSSEGIQDATYEAQKAMEKLYTIANKSGSIHYLGVDSIPGTSFTKSSADLTKTCIPEQTGELSNVKAIYQYNNASSTEPFKTNLTISPLCDYEFAVKVLIEVNEKNSNITKARIENVYILKP
jgi:prepilin-type N-terminal cleavage/methylation domain-containing protein